MRKARTRDADKTRHGAGVRPPDRWSEFQVQAYLWSELRYLFDIHGEVAHTFPDRSKVRFDLAIFDGGSLAVIIECKHENKQQYSNWGGTKQGRRYSNFAVPVVLVKGQMEAQNLVAKAIAGGIACLLDAADELGLVAHNAAGDPHSSYPGGGGRYPPRKAFAARH